MEILKKDMPISQNDEIIVETQEPEWVSTLERMISETYGGEYPIEVGKIRIPELTIENTRPTSAAELYNDCEVSKKYVGADIVGRSYTFAFPINSMKEKEEIDRISNALQGKTLLKANYKIILASSQEEVILEFCRGKLRWKKS